MWALIGNKFAKFHAKRLNWSENIPKRLGAIFLKHPYQTAPFSMSLNDRKPTFQGQAILWRWISPKWLKIAKDTAIVTMDNGRRIGNRTQAFK